MGVIMFDTRMSELVLVRDLLYNDVKGEWSEALNHFNEVLLLKSLTRITESRMVEEHFPHLPNTFIFATHRRPRRC